MLATPATLLNKPPIGRKYNKMAQHRREARVSGGYEAPNLFGRLRDSRRKGPLLQLDHYVRKAVRSQSQFVARVRLDEPNYDPLSQSLRFIDQWEVVAITSDQRCGFVVAPKSMAEHVLGQRDVHALGFLRLLGLLENVGVEAQSSELFANVSQQIIVTNERGIVERADWPRLCKRRRPE